MKTFIFIALILISWTTPCVADEADDAIEKGNSIYKMNATAYYLKAIALMMKEERDSNRKEIKQIDVEDVLTRYPQLIEKYKQEIEGLEEGCHCSSCQREIDSRKQAIKDCEWAIKEAEEERDAKKDSKSNIREFDGIYWEVTPSRPD